MSLNAQSPGALHKEHTLNAWNGAPEGTVEREKVNGIYHINSGDVKTPTACLQLTLRLTSTTMPARAAGWSATTILPLKNLERQL